MRDVEVPRTVDELARVARPTEQIHLATVARRGLSWRLALVPGLVIALAGCAAALMWGEAQRLTDAASWSEDLGRQRMLFQRTAALAGQVALAADRAQGTDASDLLDEARRLLDALAADHDARLARSRAAGEPLRSQVEDVYFGAPALEAQVEEFVERIGALLDASRGFDRPPLTEEEMQDVLASASSTALADALDAASAVFAEHLAAEERRARALAGALLGLGAVVATGLGLGVLRPVVRRLETETEHLAEARLRVAERGTRLSAANRELERREEEARERSRALLGVMEDLEAERGRLRDEVSARERVQAELAATNAELARSNAEIEEFVYTVSHDLKSPLVTIRGFLEHLSDAVASGDRGLADDAVARLERASRRMQGMLEDLLEVSRVGRVPDHSEWIETQALVEAVIEEHRSALDARAVAVDIAPDLPRLQVDRQRVREVLDNLVVNVLAHGVEGPAPHVWIGFERTAEEIRLFVADDGPGIDERHRERAFGLFQRLTTRTAGSGVGLAKVKRVLEAHGGRAWIESPPAGRERGTAVWLAFPARLGVHDPSRENPALAGTGSLVVTLGARADARPADRS